MLIERNDLIQECREMDSNFITPFDYKEFKKSQRILVPDYEEVNFIQMIMGVNG